MEHLHRLAPVILFTLAGVLTSCSNTEEFVAPPPMQVEVAHPIVQDTRVYLTFPGRADAESTIEIRARVKGFLKSREFQAGDFVEEGTLLFTIEPEQFVAADLSATANLQRAKADLKLAEVNLQKLEQAFEKKAVSEVDVLTARADVDIKKADVSIAEAASDDAKRDLSYTQITAPVSGRISDSRVDRGNLVGAGDATLLTTITKDRPIYFNFEASERKLVPYLPDLPTSENPSMAPRRPEDSEMELLLSDGTMHTIEVPNEETPDPDDTIKVPELGRIDFVDNTISEQTGTIKMRALFDNADGNLVDGAFGRIRIPQEIVSAVKVPAAVVQRDLGGNYVLVVGDDNKIQRRVVIPTEHTVEVDTGEFVEDFRILEPYDEVRNTGVTAEDKVVVSNLQRSRPGLEVVPRMRGESPPAPPEGGQKESPKEEGKAPQDKAEANGESKAE
ncbi:MAG: efflux RND transporter periplasmic adaptor subunit [Verrucomicrobiota bacterium]